MDAVYVLHRRPYRETSLLLDVFSLARGRCTAIYRTNRKQPPLEPFGRIFLLSAAGESCRTLRKPKQQGLSVD